MVDPIPFLLPGWQQTVGAVRVPPRGLGLLEPGQQHGLQRDHVVVGERQGLEPGTPALQSTHTLHFLQREQKCFGKLLLLRLSFM